MPAGNTIPVLCGTLAVKSKASMFHILYFYIEFTKFLQIYEKNKAEIQKEKRARPKIKLNNRFLHSIWFYSILV